MAAPDIEKSSNLFRWVVIPACVFAPLTLLRVTPRRAGTASYLLCLSIGCVVWAGARWWRSRGGDSAREPLEDNSPELRRMQIVVRTLRLLSIVCFGLAGLLSRQWTEEQIPWNSVVQAPGFLFLVWAEMVSESIRERRPQFVSPTYPLNQVSRPLQSEHWGEAR